MSKKSQITILFLVLIFSVFCCFHTVYAYSGKSLNKTSVSLEVNQKYKLRLSNAKKQDIRWISSNPQIASVKNGTVYAKKAGRCKITAVYKGKKYKCLVSVKKSKEKDEELSLAVKSFDEDSQVLTWHLKNNSDTVINIGEEFTLHIFRDNQWVPVDLLEGVAFQDIAMVLNPKEDAEIPVNLSEYFPKLEPGKYKISYNLGERGMLSAEFLVK